MLSLAFVLTACGKSGTDPVNIDNPSGLAPHRGGLGTFLRGGIVFAAVVADESRVAEIGRDVLSSGGNAFDAAVAMYFAQAVTLPSAASLGAAGVCLANNQKTRVGEMFSFPPTAAPGPIGGVAFNVPMGARAITLMHIRHATQRFEQLIAPAERLARFGVPLSRALARDLRSGDATLGTDREARRVFAKAGGAPLAEGDTWIQSDLAGTLGSLRQTGGVDLFQGRLARTVSDQIALLGGSLPMEALRNAVPVTGNPPSESFSSYRVYVAPTPFAGQAALAGWNGQDAGGGASPDSGGFAGFSVVDREGNAVTCATSMGQVFGARIVVPGTGILLGAITANTASLSPMLIASPSNGEFVFAGAGGGSPFAATATGAVARAAVQGGESVQQVLARRGGRGGHVGALACPRGLRGGAPDCTGASDPAGFGLALPALAAR